MTNQCKSGAIGAQITKESGNGNFYRLVDEQQKYIDAFDNVEALELKLTDEFGDAGRESEILPNPMAARSA